jgi:hypothetical protein
MTLFSPARLAVFVALLAPLSALAVPRFAVQNNASCVLCHVNPTGGGLRNSYGRDIFERTRLSFAWADKKEPKDPKRSGFLGNSNGSLHLGGDARFAYLYVNDSPQDLDEDPDLDALFLMQSDLYVGASLSEDITFAAEIGLRGAFEAYGLVQNLPGKTYLKAGVFTPPFGWRFPEHTNVNRIDLGFDPGVADTGFELGHESKSLSANLMFSAGQLVRSPNLADGIFTRGQTALSGTVQYRTELDPLKLSLGLSAAYDHDQGTTRTRLVSQNTLRTDAANGAALEADQIGNNVEVFRETKVGGTLGASLGRLWYLGELDVVSNSAVASDVGQQFLDQQAATRFLNSVGYLSYQEIGVSVMQGLDIYTAIEYHDPDIAVSADPANPSASDPVLRTGLFVEFFPADNVEILGLFRHNSAALGGLVKGANDAVLMLHFFY